MRVSFGLMSKVVPVLAVLGFCHVGSPGGLAQQPGESGELKHPKVAFSAAFSPGGELLATACEDQKVRLWDVASRKEKAVLAGHSDEVLMVTFSPDGTLVASGSGKRVYRPKHGV